MPRTCGKILRKAFDMHRAVACCSTHCAIRSGWCGVALGLALTLCGTANTFAAQASAVPASTTSAARAPIAPIVPTVPVSPTINTAILQANGKTIPTAMLVYVGDYATLSPVSSSPLLYNGDYGPQAPVVTGVLLYTGAYPPMQAAPLVAK